MSAASAAPSPFSPFVYGVSKRLLTTWALVWLRLRVEGRELAPKDGPLLAVGNHCSYLDPPLLGIAVPRRVGFLAQKGLARFPPLRWWLSRVGASLIDRKAPSKDVLRALASELEAGGCVSVFPEGTRSVDGTVGPFRSGVEFLVRRTGAKVLPVGIEGSFRSFRKGAYWPRPTRCIVRVGAPWQPDRVLAPGGIEALRREVATLAHARLRPDAGAQSARVDHGPGAIPADPSPSAGNRT